MSTNSATGTSRTVDADLPCVRCGYNLRTQVWSARCPECGLAVNASTVAGRLHLQSWRHVRLFRIATAVLILGMLVPAISNLVAVCASRWRFDIPIATFRSVYRVHAWADFTSDATVVVAVMLYLLALRRGGAPHGRHLWLIAVIILLGMLGYGVPRLPRTAGPLRAEFTRAVLTAMRSLSLLLLAMLFASLVPRPRPQVLRWSLAAWLIAATVMATSAVYPVVKLATSIGGWNWYIRPSIDKSLLDALAAVRYASAALFVLGAWRFAAVFAPRLDPVKRDEFID